MTNERNTWLSDEDMEEFDSWADDVLAAEPDGEPTPANASSADGASSTPLPEYLDPGIAEELAGEMVPVWFGTRWRDIPVEDQPDAWNGLRQWVDWLVKEYRLPTAVVPPCWYRHTDVVAELYAAMCMEYKVWEEGEPGLNPMMFWHPNLQQMIFRLREAVTNAGCVENGAHKEPLAVDGHEPFQLDYDEDDWFQRVNEVTATQRIERPDTGVVYVRAGLVDSNGEMFAYSSPVGVGQRSVMPESAVDIQYLSTDSDYNVLQANWQHYRQDCELTWEVSTDGASWIDVDEWDNEEQSDDDH